jgi:electron transfer flavoprotein alpha subunit
LSTLPVEKVYLLQHPALAGSGAGGYEASTDAVVALCRSLSPDVVLFAKTDFGANVGVRAGFRLGAPVAQDCTAITAGATHGSVIITRPVYGGSAVAEFELSGPGPKIVIVRPGSYEAVALDGGSPETVQPDPSADIKEPRVKLIGTAKETQTGVRLEDAQVVVSGGRGLGGPEPFRQLAELAGLLGGAVGASRAACDAGWIDHAHQVGLTGKTVSPRLYLAIAISGASQHMAGCSSSGTIVAINRDREANIFKEARFGVAGDWQKVLPAFIATVRDLGRA